MIHKFIRLSNQYLHYLEAGKGKTVILLPSLWVTSKSYAGLGDILSQKYHVLIPDIFKGSSVFTQKATDLYDYIDPLLEFLKLLRLSEYYLIGISGSGFLASAFINRTSHKPKHLLLFSTTYHPDVLNGNRVLSILKSYLLLLWHNFHSWQGTKINLLWLGDGLTFLFRHPYQYFQEVLFDIEDKYQLAATPVPTTLYTATQDEFLSLETVVGKNEKIKNLQVVPVVGYHTWFFFTPLKFLDCLRQAFG
jgi:pimeloyl-ACP methyl ester carboxylesterase